MASTERPDPTLARRSLLHAATADRRENDRRDSSDVEVLVAWSHAPKTPVRYRAIDVSGGGMRIRSMLPLREHATGAILSTVPHTSTLNRSFQIMWCRKIATDEGSGVSYEAGLRFDT